MSLIAHEIRIYVCPSRHRPPSMAFNRSLCGQCGLWRESVDLVPEAQLAGAVKALREVKGEIEYAIASDMDLPLRTANALLKVVDRALANHGGQ